MHESARGYTLLEVLLGSSILAVLFAAISIMLNITAENVGRNRATRTAQGLAQDQIETIRGMSYEDLGTIGGIPAGVLEDVVDTVVNGVTYTTTTTVIYIDDDYDGVVPTDTVPTDYKRARVVVSWGGVFESTTPVVLWTDVAPRGKESDSGGGIIEITVFDANGVVVPGATVSLDAPTASPSVQLIADTDSNGMVVLPGAPACTECYRVSVTKSGYTSDRTYAISEVANPVKPDLTVIDNAKTSLSFAIDRLSSITFRATRGAAFNYSTFQGVQFKLRGSKVVGTTAVGDPVYKTDLTAATGFGGVVTVNNLEWDTYTLSLPAGSVVDFAGSVPFSPFGLNPSSGMNVNFVVAAAMPNTYLLKIMNNLQSPVASAAVTLRNDAIGYIATLSAPLAPRGDQAQAFFSNLPSTTVPFLAEVSSVGFLPASSEATVSGDVIEQLILQPE